MVSVSHGLSDGQNLIFWQPNGDSDGTTEADTSDMKVGESSSAGEGEMVRKRQSMYVELFEEMAHTVIDHDTALILEHEAACILRYAQMSYDARYLMIRLCLRKSNKWHRLSALKYQSELGDCIAEAIQELCQFDEDQEDPAEASTTAGALASDVAKHYLFLAQDESRASLRELLECLSVDELKQITKQMKLKLAKNREGLIANLLAQSATQTTLGFSVTRSAKGKERAGTKPLKQTTLPFLKLQVDRLRVIVLKLLGKCVKVNEHVMRLFQRVNLIYFRNTEYSSTILTQAILARARKRNYPAYAYARTANIWPSRDALLAYEEALEVEMKVDSLLEGSRFPDMPPPDITADKKPKFESSRVQNATAVAELFESVYPRWKALVEDKGEESARTHGLERFDCGHVLTRVVCKCAYALGVLHQHERELEVLEALLAQKRWRRGRRGRWYERRALILMTHLSQNNETKMRAYKAVVESLVDDDTSIVARPKLERRLTKLEKELKIPEENRHVCQGELKKPEKVFIEGVRIWHRGNSLVLDSALKSVSASTSKNGQGSALRQTSLEQWGKHETTPIDVDEIAPQPWTGKSIWSGRDDEEVTVEILALQYYESLGFKGFHCEGQIIRTLFGLLFWDVIFAPVPGAFETPYQSAPLDIAEDTFYFSRKEIADQLLESIRLGHAPEILRRVIDEHSSKQTSCVGVRWDVFSSEDLLEIATCLGGPALAVICRMLCEDYAGRAGGVPDLIIWNAQEGLCKFVEVKGPGDTVQENQKLWHDVLLRAGVSVDLCHVAESTSETERKPKIVKTKAGKPKRKRDPESEEEEEMDFSQMDIPDESNNAPMQTESESRKRPRRGVSVLSPVSKSRRSHKQSSP